MLYSKINQREPISLNLWNLGCPAYGLYGKSKISLSPKSKSSICTVVARGHWTPLVVEGGYSGFQVIGMIKWGQKSKPKKIPGPKFNPPPPPPKKKKIPMPNFLAIKTSRKHDVTKKNGNISFEYPKKSVLKSSDPKKILRSPLSCAIQSTPWG